MLPFLNPKKQSGVVVATVKPEGGIDSKGEEGEMDAGLMSAAEDLLSAIAMKDANSVAMALLAAFEICDELPHVEGPHIEEQE